MATSPSSSSGNRSGATSSHTKDSDVTSQRDTRSSGETPLRVLAPIVDLGVSPKTRKLTRTDFARLEDDLCSENKPANRIPPITSKVPAITPGEIENHQAAPAATSENETYETNAINDGFVRGHSHRRRSQRHQMVQFREEDIMLLRDIRKKVDVSLANGFGGDPEATRRLRMKRIFDAMSYNTDSRYPKELIQLEVERLDSEKNGDIAEIDRDKHPYPMMESCLGRKGPF